MPELLEERLLPERLRDDDGDEVRLAARQPPDLLEDGVGQAAGGVERLERWVAAGAVEPAWPDARIGSVPRHMDGAETVG